LESLTLSPNTLNPVDIRKQFHTQGYYVIPSVFTIQEVKDMRAELLDIFQDRLEKGLKIPKNDTLQDVLADFLLYYPQFIPAFANDRLMEVIEILAGPNPILLPDSSCIREYYGKIHTDTTGTEEAGFTFHKEPDFNLITVGLYLQDNNEYGGGLFAVPGTHLKQDPYIEIVRKFHAFPHSKWKQFVRKWSFDLFFNYDRALADHPKGIDLPNKAGDIVLFNAKIIHRASYSKVKTPAPHGGKLALFSRFSSNNRHAHNWTDYLRDCNPGGYEYLKEERDITNLQHAFDPYGAIVM
jgi:ectoine hydroxylase-related dioxygenase (phytanoyl-CoA dioxygenase family)